MNMTRIAATTTHSVSSATLVLSRLPWRPVKVVLAIRSIQGRLSRLRPSLHASTPGGQPPGHVYREPAPGEAHWPEVQDLDGAVVRVEQRLPEAAGIRAGGPRPSARAGPRVEPRGG